MTSPLLQVDRLQVHFGHGSEALRAVDGLSYSVDRGRAVAIVGESGSGKTVGVRALLNLLPATAHSAGGSAIFDGLDLLKLSDHSMRRVRGRRIGMVFQNAMEALSPTATLQQQLIEPLLWHRVCNKRQALDRAVQALADVGIPEPATRIRMYPFQLSGGMRQRAMIAMANITEPELLIADEPTTAVDVTLQRQILDLLALRKKGGTSIIMITHDLGVARYFCDSVVVMYAGHVVESAPMAEFLKAPAHPYSKALIESSIEIGDRDRPLRPIPGEPADPAHRPTGCPFRPRCPQGGDPQCEDDQSQRIVDVNWEAACWRVGADA